MFYGLFVIGSVGMGKCHTYKKFTDGKMNIRTIIMNIRRRTKSGPKS